MTADELHAMTEAGRKLGEALREALRGLREALRGLAEALHELAEAFAESRARLRREATSEQVELYRSAMLSLWRRYSDQCAAQHRRSGTFAEWIPSAEDRADARRIAGIP